MTETDAIGILQQAVWITIIAAGPMVVAAMIVGTLIAVLQALLTGLFLLFWTLLCPTLPLNIPGLRK